MFKPAKCPEDCMYLQSTHGGAMQMCGYLLITNQLRGCDPGKNCKRYVGLNDDLKHAKHRRVKWDVVKGKEMWLKGCNDSQIAREVNVKRDTVKAYRLRVWEKEKEADECV